MPKHPPIVSCIKNVRIRGYDTENQVESRSKYCETFNSFRWKENRNLYRVLRLFSSFLILGMIVEEGTGITFMLI
jgi:hypothetical protein